MLPTLWHGQQDRFYPQFVHPFRQTPAPGCSNQFIIFSTCNVAAFYTTRHDTWQSLNVCLQRHPGALKSENQKAEIPPRLSHHIQVTNQVGPCARTAQTPAQLTSDTTGVHDQLREKREEQGTNKTRFARFYATWLIYSLLAASTKSGSSST